MTSFTFPNESKAYRRERDKLLDEEVHLRAQIEAVAEQRRVLPRGGALPEDYEFARIAGRRPTSVRFVDLFGDHDTLLLYSMMFGTDWDAPCPSCTAIVDAMNVSRLAVEERAGIAVVAAASPEQLHAWCDRRGWDITVVSGALNGYLTDYAGFETEDAALVSAMNVFTRTDEGIFHFWASELLSRPMADGHPRHADSIWPLWNLLDMTPGGRGDALVPKQDFEHSYFDEHVLDKASGTKND